ncbi:MAG: hypothetical protein PHS99_06785 [Candidatus Marinimicrobia bacterium]|nr:hypothetical protein [Candidatus Neomarinimicrobiota bacterium]
MKKIIIIPLLLLLATTLFSEETNEFYDVREKPKDSWVTFDKWQHFSFSLLMTVQSAYVLSHDSWVYNPPDKHTCIVSAGISLSFGVFKELLDKSKKPTGFFSWKDLVMDIGGTFTGVLMLKSLSYDF